MNKYIDDETFLKLLKNYKIEKQKNSNITIPNSIGKVFLLISKNFLNKPQCINYTQDRKDEIISKSCYYMCKYLDRYNVDAGTSPFSYFTQIALNSFRQCILEQKNYSERFINLSFIENFEKFENIESIEMDWYD